MVQLNVADGDRYVVGQPSDLTKSEGVGRFGHAINIDPELGIGSIHDHGDVLPGTVRCDQNRGRGRNLPSNAAATAAA